MNTKMMNSDELVKAINTLKDEIFENRSKNGQRGDWFYVKMDGERVLEYKGGQFTNEKIWEVFMNLDLKGAERTISTIESDCRYNNLTSIKIRTSKINPKKVSTNINFEVIDALRECVDTIKNIVGGDNEENNKWNVEKKQVFLDSNTEWCVRNILRSKWARFYINGYEIDGADVKTVKEVLTRYQKMGFGVHRCCWKGSNGNGYFSMTLEPMFHLTREDGNMRDELLNELFNSLDKYDGLFLGKENNK